MELRINDKAYNTWRDNGRFQLLDLVQTKEEGSSSGGDVDVSREIKYKDFYKKGNDAVISRRNRNWIKRNWRSWWSDEKKL